MSKLLCQAGKRLCWHGVCTLGGVWTIVDTLPPAWRTGASVVLGGIIVLPDVLTAWQETKEEPHG
jgi:hypothetical protein